MAKALYGHMAGADARLLSEVGRLRARVRELEELVDRMELERGLELDTIELDSGLVRTSA